MGYMCAYTALTYIPVYEGSQVLIICGIYFYEILPNWLNMIILEIQILNHKM